MNSFFKKIFSRLVPKEDLLPPELAGRVFTADSTEVDDEVLFAAKKYFGITHVFPWQRLVIGNILDAQRDEKIQDDATDVFCLGRQVVLLPTGAGKSLCFLLPAVMLPGPTLIFYPLLALMSDQERHLKKNGIECVVFRGGQSPAEREENFRKIKGGVKIILANPEVLQSQSLVSRLRDCKISHIAIDEAHCVAEWGDTFRPAYLTLGKIISDLGVDLVTAFTATASPEVLGRVCQVLFAGRVHIVRAESDRPNIRYFVQYAWSKKKAACRLAVTEQRPMIIFCGTRHKAEDMARELKECIDPEKVRFYHAGLSRDEKAEVESWFMPKKDAVLCCTCAFGMGVDKSDIRTVVHLDVSSDTAESYVQEAGRGGRDKKVSKAIMLWSREDSVYFEKFPHKSRNYVMKRFAESGTCRRQVLLDALGGEKALCSGCDVCQEQERARAEGKKYFPKTFFNAPDASFVYKFVRKNRNFYDKNQAMKIVKDKFNQNDRRLFGKNIWDSSDVEEIFSQLQQSGSVYNAGFLWNYRLGAEKSIMSPPRRRRLANPRLVLLRHLKRFAARALARKHASS